jgi:hypothetical protein
MNREIMSIDPDWNEDYYDRPINPKIMTSLINELFGNNEFVSEERMVEFFNKFLPIFQQRNPSRRYYRFMEEDFENFGRPISKPHAEHIIMYRLNGDGLTREFEVDFEIAEALAIENAKALARLVHTGKTNRSVAYSIVNSLTNKHNPHLDNEIFGEAIKSRKRRNKKGKKGKKGKKSKKVKQ